MAKQEPKSRYGRKKAWRKNHCGGVPLPLFPEVMAIPPSRKPWGPKKRGGS